MIVLEGIIRWGLYLILLTPLLISTRFMSPFLTAKVLAFQILVDIVVGAVAGLYLLLMRRERQQATMSFLPGRSPLLVVLATCLGYALVTAFVGVDLNRSLWGIVDRRDGLILQLHFLAWLAVLAWFYQNQGVAQILNQPPNPKKKTDRSPSRVPNDFHFYLKLSFWVSAAVAATVIYMWLELHFKLLNLVPESVKGPFQGRVGGVFGNPTFAGPYFLFHFFYGLYLLSQFVRAKLDIPSSSNSHPRRPRNASVRWTAQATWIAIAQCMILSALLLGQIRGVLLGLVAGFFVVAVCIIFSRSLALRMRIAAAVLTALFIVGSLSLWQLRDTAVAKSIPFLKRLTQTSFTELSVSARLMAWQSALSSIKDHPILGWGENNVYYGLNKYYNPALVRFDPNETQTHLTWYDKSHNAYLDLLAEKGIVGALLYLVLIVVTARSLWLLKDRYLAFFTSGSLTAYLVSNFVAFDSFGSLYGLYLFLTPLLLSDYEKKPPGPEPVREAPTEGGKGGAMMARLLGALRKPAAIFVLLLAICSLYISIETGTASVGYQDAQQAFAQDPDLGLRSYEVAFQYYSPYQKSEKLRCATLTLESVLNKRPMRDPMGSVGRALQWAQEAAAAFPRDVAIFISLADICNNLGLYVDKSFLDKAEYFGKRALELSPKRQEAAFCLGRTYVLRNEAPRAVELNKRMVSDYPAYPLAHWFLGLSLIADGKRDEARREIQKAFDLGFRFRNAGEENVVKDLFEK
jgi:O-antigen ligase